MSNKTIIIIVSSILLLGIIFVTLGFVTSRGIQMNKHEIDKDFNIKFGHITDTHFDNRFERTDYDVLVDNINNEEVDVLLFTGDLFQVVSVDEELEDNVISLLNELEADYKIAVLGNHDYNSYSEARADVVRILEATGFTILINESIQYDINDSTYNFLGMSNYSSIIDEIDENAINFVLSHEPDTFEYVTDESIVAMFSGHSHGGQIRLPLIGDVYNVPGARIYNDHHYNVDGRDLYVSFGLGESMIRIRFYNKRQFEIYNYS
jgi:predicted MPP superfamily phosphohydrolase